MTNAFVHVLAYFTVLEHRLDNRFEGRRDRGATAVEYGLLVGLIAIVMITGVALVGPKLSTMFTTVSGKL
jgi:pilus assembly protein Flp/PilA